MVGGLEFIGVIATLAIILAWYTQNVEGDSEAGLGWFAIAADPAPVVPTSKKRSYAVKHRLAYRAHELRDVESVRTAAANAKPSYRLLDEDGSRTRRAYRQLDEARYGRREAKPRYHAKEETKRYKPRTGPAANIRA